MLNHSILTLTVIFPVAAAVVVALLPRRDRLIRWFALVATLGFFALTLHLPAHYQYGAEGFQFEIRRAWIASPKIAYHVGVDGISLWLVGMIGLLAPVAVLASWKAIDRHVKEFYFFLLLQQSAMIGVLISLDLFLYYAFWVLALVPMTFFMVSFGPGRSARAALKFFLYAFLSSSFLLGGILWLCGNLGTFDFVQLQAALGRPGNPLSGTALLWVSLGFLAASAVRIPIFPLHGWLADVFVEAPSAISMEAAGTLGLYSLVRFNLELFPEQACRVAPWMIALAVVGILYGALVALAQTNLKRLAAFVILSGLSSCVLGIFCFTVTGIDGAIYQALNEGILGSALLILLGFMHERYQSYELAGYGGLATRMPGLAAFFFIASMALIGLPLLNGFVGEFLILSGSFARHAGWVTAATAGGILIAACMLGMMQRVFYGSESKIVAVRGQSRLSLREHIVLWPLAALMLAMGIGSPFWMRAIDQSVENLAVIARPVASPQPHPPLPVPLKPNGTHGPDGAEIGR